MSIKNCGLQFKRCSILKRMGSAKQVYFEKSIALHILIIRFQIRFFRQSLVYEVYNLVSEIVTST